MDQGNHLKKIPFILVTGFLGSGKTSLLLDLIGKYSGQLRIAIVQNEFAPGHTDGVTLTRSHPGISLLEINNGSVFCACLLGDFLSRIGPFIQKAHPDLILLEATGLADPISMGQMIEAPELQDYIYFAGSWCVVDALHFHITVQNLSRVKQQVRIADVIWLNKTDLVPDTTPIRTGIQKINPFAPIYQTTFGKTDDHPLDEILPSGIQFNGPGGISPDGTDYGPSVPHNPPPYFSCVVRSNRYFHEDLVRDFVMDQTASLHRIKGYIRLNESKTLAIQTVYSEISFVVIDDYNGPSELIALGPSLDKRLFSKQILALQK